SKNLRFLDAAGDFFDHSRPDHDASIISMLGSCRRWIGLVGHGAISSENAPGTCAREKLLRVLHWRADHGCDEPLDDVRGRRDVCPAHAGRLHFLRTGKAAPAALAMAGMRATARHRAPAR